MKKELTPTSAVDIVAILSEEYIPQVQSYAALGYSPTRIANIIGLKGIAKDALITAIRTVGSPYNETYHRGVALGELNIDTELAKMAEAGDVDAIERLEERNDERVIRDLRRTLFGV